MPSTPPSGKFIATFFRPSYGTMVVKLVGMIISLGGLASSTINHHQPSTINHHQPSSTIINHHQPSSTIINHHQPSSTINPYIFMRKDPTSQQPSTHQLWQVVYILHLRRGRPPLVLRLGDFSTKKSGNQ